jgi:SAM-dependent methyltransferase
MAMNPFVRRADPYLLVVGMTGVKLGDRVVQVGCAHAGRLAAIAGKVGLSGRAMLVAADEASAALARRAAEKAGVLVDVEVGPATRLPLEAGSFDLAVVDDTGGLLTTMGPEDRAAAIRELLGALRPGGRAVIIGAVRRGGLRAIFSRAPGRPSFAASGEAVKTLEAAGFRSARTLAERDGLVFVEAIKPRSG